MVKKINKKPLFPCVMGTLFLIKFFYFNFFTIILLLLYIFFNSTQATKYIKNVIIIK